MPFSTVRGIREGSRRVRTTKAAGSYSIFVKRETATPSRRSSWWPPSTKNAGLACEAQFLRLNSGAAQFVLGLIECARLASAARPPRLQHGVKEPVGLRHSSASHVSDTLAAAAARHARGSYVAHARGSYVATRALESATRERFAGSRKIAPPRAATPPPPRQRPHRQASPPPETSPVLSEMMARHEAPQRLVPPRLGSELLQPSEVAPPWPQRGSYAARHAGMRSAGTSPVRHRAAPKRAASAERLRGGKRASAAAAERVDIVGEWTAERLRAASGLAASLGGSLSASAASSAAPTPTPEQQHGAPSPPIITARPPTPATAAAAAPAAADGVAAARARLRAARDRRIVVLKTRWAAWCRATRLYAVERAELRAAAEAELERRREERRSRQEASEAAQRQGAQPRAARAPRADAGRPRARSPGC